MAFKENTFWFGRLAPSKQIKNKTVLRAQELRACNALKTARSSRAPSKPPELTAIFFKVYENLLLPGVKGRNYCGSCKRIDAIS